MPQIFIDRLELVVLSRAIQVFEEDVSFVVLIKAAVVLV